MVRKLALLAVLVASSFLAWPEDASACHRRGSGCCVVECTPCCQPCGCLCWCEVWVPCYKVYTQALCYCCDKDCTHCPPGWHYCYVPEYCQWLCCYSYYCWPLKGEKPAHPPAKTTSLTPGSDDTALVNVTLPADATLAIDGQPTTSTSGSRTFVTPALTAGTQYVYTLRAEARREGQIIATTKEVIVRAGGTTNVTIELPRAVTASR
ncbi:MAG TPA: TIGR03000 domain-containing protein [Gemmataceae bacterium]|nr:TIGR03000 domain-containing protein [Gemmataceae bacterium]